MFVLFLCAAPGGDDVHGEGADPGRLVLDRAGRGGDLFVLRGDEPVEVREAARLLPDGVQRPLPFRND